MYGLFHECTSKTSTVISYLELIQSYELAYVCCSLEINKTSQEVSEKSENLTKKNHPKLFKW